MRVLILIIISFILPTISFGQSTEVTFSQWVNEMSSRFSIEISYNSELLSELSISSPECESWEKCFDEITQRNPIHFEEVSERYYLAIPVRNTAFFAVNDEEKKDVHIIEVTRNNETVFLLPESTRYSLENVFPTDSIIIFSRFFESDTVLGKDLLTEEASVTLYLKTILLNEVIISDYLTAGVDVNMVDHSMQVDMKELGTIAGDTDGDILLLLKNLPGVRTPDGKPGSLNFRGSTFDQTQFYLDDIPIYHQGHFFGTISPYDPSAVNQVNVHRGTLPARHGGRVGGLVDLSTSDDVADSALYSISSNTLYAGFNASIPVVKEKIGLTLSSRSNYPIDYLFPKLDAFQRLNFQGSKIDSEVPGGDRELKPLSIEFRDFNAKIIFEATSRHHFSINYMNIANDFSYEFLSAGRSLREEQDSDLNNWGSTIKYIGSYGKGIIASLSYTKSRLFINERNRTFENSDLSEANSISSDLDDDRINVGVTFPVGERSKAEIGQQLVVHKINANEQRSIDEGNEERENKGTVSSTYSSLQTTWSSKFTTTLGVRSDHYSVLSKRYFDLRFLTNYMLHKNLYVKASAGESHQFIYRVVKTDFDDFRLQNQIWKLADNKSPVLRGRQMMLGFLFDRGDWLLDVEAYLKQTDGISSQVSPSESEIGTLFSKGIDVFLKKRWNGAETWISYSISRVDTEFTTKERAYFDQTHLVNTTTIFTWGKWSFAASWSLQSGMPVYLPELDPNHSNSNGQTSLDIEFTSEYPLQHQLDLSASYKFWKTNNSYRAIVGMSIQNLYNRKNVINVFQNNPRVDQPFRYALGFAPNINLKISF